MDLLETPSYGHTKMDVEKGLVWFIHSIIWLGFCINIISLFVGNISFFSFVFG